MKTTVTLEFNNSQEFDEFTKKMSFIAQPEKLQVKEENSDEVYLVMKDGHESEEPTMDNIRGICIPTLNRERFILYPKYKGLPLLSRDKVDEYNGKCYTEVEALYTNNNHQETSDLLAIGSEAAKFVRGFGMDLPSLSMCIAIAHFKDEINAISGKIKGADLIDDSYRWSSSRYNTYTAWYYNYNGITYSNYFSYSFTVSAVSAF